MAFFLIYGARPICHLNRKEVEAGEHLGIIHKGYRGGAYNKRFEEEILKRGGYENVTVDDILEIRDILVKEFGIK